jgi:hypothetical protein
MTNPTRYYSSTASKTTLALAISSTDLSLQLSAASNLPILYPYTLILEKDTANEEVVQVNSLVGTSYQIQRNIDSSGAKAHAIGAAVEHGVSARDFTESRAHEAAAIAHDTTSAIVGKDDTQTLTNKTLGASNVLGANLAAGGFKITGLGTPTSSADAATKGYIDTQTTSAAASAAAALVSQNAAASSAIASASSQVISTAAASTATASATTATNSAATAVTSAAAAATSAASALTSQTSATASASAALVSQNAAATSATSASNSATTAAASVATISASAAQAATSASSSLTSQQSAAISASSAATSASSAATSLASVIGTTGAGIVRDMGSIADPDTTTGTYVSIATLTDTATTSAAQAATSAASAATSAGIATASAATAVTSAATAVSSAATAVASAATAVTSAATAVSSAAIATSSAATAVTSAGQAATSASSALASQTAAATSATSAANSATAADTSATSASASATAAAASYDSFDDRYLGAKSSAPSVDNDGNALITGALYFNSVTPGMYVWTGSAWTVMATSGDIESVAAGTGLSGGGTAGAVTVSLDTSSVYVVPSQTSNTGKFLTTDGTSASWVSISDWGTL